MNMHPESWTLNAQIGIDPRYLLPKIQLENEERSAPQDHILNAALGKF